MGYIATLGLRATYCKRSYVAFVALVAYLFSTNTYARAQASTIDKGDGQQGLHLDAGGRLSRCLT